MADSAIGMSDVSVAPSDSASQAPKSQQSAPSKRGGPRKGPSQPRLDKDAPQGAVQVPAGGQKKTGKSSAVLSTAIPLSGWGDIDLHPFRKEVEPVFTVDARPFADLVDTTYQSIQARYSAGGKHIPLGLFRHYCFTFWWLRSLWLHKSNGNVLTTEEKNALNILLAGEEFSLPSHIAQYLANMGNFQQGGENFYYRKPDETLGSFTTPDMIVKKGWFDVGDAPGHVTAEEFWLYAQLPTPGVYTSFVCNEANSLLGNVSPTLTLAAVAPEFAGNNVLPTDNIIGWNNSIPLPHHNSWKATYSSLGWSGSSVPPDTQTVFNISTSSMRWMSERLSTLKDFKLHLSKQITLSTQGSPMQSHYLTVTDLSTQRDQRPPALIADSNSMNASRFSELAIASRFAIDSSTLAASFSFGYRLERTLVFDKYASDGKPVLNLRSNFQPWLVTKKDDSAYVSLDRKWYSQMNAPFHFGSQPYVNVARFSTHQLNRAVGLDAALVLSDVR